VTQDVLDTFAQVISVPQESFGARSLREEKDEKGLVRLRRVTPFAGEDKIIATVVRRLPLAWRYMVERQ
jgi:hypothetical protein